VTLPLVDLPGEPHLCGQAHGEHLRADIAAGIERWRADIAGSGVSPDILIADFVASRDFATATRTWTPWLIDELDGIARASGTDPVELWAYQLIDELWEFLRERLGKHRSEHCSTIGIDAGPGRTVIAQNLDLPASYDGLLHVLRIAPYDQRPGVSVVTAAGVVGMAGMNAAGVSVGVNSLPDVTSARSGLPVAAVVRGALAHTSAGLASEWLAHVPHASGQAYTIADADELTNVECDAAAVAVVPVRDGVVVHTNHALRLPRKTADTSPAAVDSAARLDFLQRHCPDALSAVEDLLTVLDDTSVPIRRADAPGMPNRTCATLMFDSADTAQAWVRGGLAESNFVDATPPMLRPRATRMGTLA